MHFVPWGSWIWLCWRKKGRNKGVVDVFLISSSSCSLPAVSPLLPLSTVIDGVWVRRSAGQVGECQLLIWRKKVRSGEDKRLWITFFCCCFKSLNFRTSHVGIKKELSLWLPLLNKLYDNCSWASLFQPSNWFYAFFNNFPPSISTLSFCFVPKGSVCAGWFISL